VRRLSTVSKCYWSDSSSHE